MKKIIIILFFFIAAKSYSQIDPYQIIKDSLGAHRILMTDSTGEYTRVLLRDAIADSIGVGKFVNGTDPLDAVYMDGNVGIGNASPQNILHIKKANPIVLIQDTETSFSNTESYIKFSGSQGSAAGGIFRTDVEQSIGYRDNSLVFDRAGVENMRINSSGNVGIGDDNPSTELSVNGAYSGEYPKDSGLKNVVFGTNNLSSHTTGINNFVNGQYNATASTTNHRSFINGERNFRYATPTIQYSFANGYNNNVNNVSSASYSMLNGIFNLEEAQGLGYTFANGRENGNDLTQANYSFFHGYRNAYNSTANTNYNTFIGRENAIGATDIDYSVFLGYQNNYSGNNSNIDYSFIAGERNAYNAGNMFATNIMGYRNAYTTSNTLNYFTAIGRENAYYPTVPMNNTILLGYRQAYNVGSEGAGSYKLAIGMYEDNPLIYGEFDNALLKINGDLQVGDDLQARLNLNSKKDGSWVSGSYMSEILFTSDDTSGAAGASTRASIRTEAINASGSPIADGSDVQLVFKIKGDVAGLPPDAMILHSNKDLEVLGGVSVAERTGTAAKSAFFDTDGKLVEGDLVSSGQAATCKIETTSSQTISSTGSPFVVFDSETIDNGSLSSDLTNNKITINEDGLYMVLFYMKLNGGNGAEFDVEIDVNGSAKEDHYQTLDSDDLMTVSGSYVGSFSNGDDVKIQIGQVTSDSGQAVENIYTGSSLTVIRL